MRAVFLAVCALFISACGGGGGGGTTAPTPAITLQPTTATATTIAGTSTGFSVVAIATSHLSGTIYVKITDPNGVLQPTATITPGSGESYAVGLMTSPSLAAGHYAGSFQVSLCYDSGCNQLVAGSPVPVAFDFTVVAAYTLAPAVLSATFTAGLPPAVSVTVTPTSPVSGPVYVSVADPGNVLSATRSVTANNNGSYSITVQPASSLAAGHVTGTLALNLCSDSACASPLAGSPVSVPYDFTVLAAPPALTLSPASANGSFVEHNPVPFLINMSATIASGLTFRCTPGLLTPAVRC